MPARARDETAAVQRRFVVLCSTLRGFANCAESYQRLHHYLSAPDSVAAREIEAGGSLATDTLSFAAMVLGGAHDHVIGLENLLSAGSAGRRLRAPEKTKLLPRDSCVVTRGPDACSTNFTSSG
jgi:hypothetical protein